MAIQIVKKGKANHGGEMQEYIIIKYPGSTKLRDIAKRFGKEYHKGFFDTVEKKEDGLYHQILWKREEPLKSMTEEDIINFIN